MNVNHIYPYNMPFKWKYLHVIDVRGYEFECNQPYRDSRYNVSYILLSFVNGYKSHQICRCGEPMGIDDVKIKHLKWKYP